MKKDHNLSTNNEGGGGGGGGGGGAKKALILYLRVIKDTLPCLGRLSVQFLRSVSA